MKKQILTSAILLAMPAISQARLTAFDATTAFEKMARGFIVTNLKTKINDSYVSGMDIEATVGRDQADFKIHLNGVLLLPVKGDADRKQARIKLGAFGLALNEDKSLDIYNVLALDFTPKKLREGIRIGDSTFNCNTPTECSIIDKVGDFNLFNGNRASSTGDVFNTYLYGHRMYEGINFQGSVLSNGNLTPSFAAALENQILEMAPDTIKYFQVSNSPATDSQTYKDHKAMAIEEMETDFGKTELERKTLKGLLINSSTKFEEKRKRSSRSGCTYFCGSSGRFVSATVFADTNF